MLLTTRATQPSAGASVSDERVLITSRWHCRLCVGKNRYDMPQEINVPKGTNPILQYIPFYSDYVRENGLYVPGQRRNRRKKLSDLKHKTVEELNALKYETESKLLN